MISENFISNFVSTAASTFLRTTILEAVFRASNPVFVTVSNKFTPYFLDRFLANEKDPYPLAYVLVLGFIEQHVISVC